MIRRMNASMCCRVLAAVMGGVLALGAKADVPMPHGYTQLEWIQSDGSQYINTKYIHQPNTRVVASFAVSKPQVGDWAAVFGARGAGNDYGFLFMVSSGTKTALKPAYECKLGSSLAYGTVALPENVRVNLECDGLTARWSSADDPSVTDTITVSGTTCTGLDTMTLFGCRQQADPNPNFFRIAMKLYSFEIYEGEVAKRKFVPCCSIEGKTGLWDLVTGEFYGDAANSANRFRNPSNQGLLLNCLESTGTQYIDTGYPHVTDTRVTASFSLSRAQPHTWSTLFGGRKQDLSNAFAFFVNSGKVNVPAPAYLHGANSNVISNYGPYLPQGERVLVECCHETSRWSSVADPAATNVLGVAQQESVGDGNLYVFATRTGTGTDFASCVKLHDLEIYDATGRKVRDYRPYRQPDGRIGLYDFANHDGETGYEPFRTNQGPGAFGWDYSYSTNGTTLCIHDGTLPANDDFLGFSSVEKTGIFALAASAKMTYPDLTLSQGPFSLRDGVRKEYAVTGTLTLKGGAVLEIDLTREGCDTLSATAVDTAAASVSNPVVLSFAAQPDANLDAPYPILCCEGLVTEDAAKFSLVGVTDAALRVEDGVLYVYYSDPSVPMVSVWTGASVTDPTNLGNPDNWASTNGSGVAISAAPTAMTSVRLSDDIPFNCPAGKTLTCRELVLPTKLTDNCDWCGVTVPLVGTLDLNGHTLRVSSLQGTATITDNSGYQRLEWVASTSGGKQYVDTEYQIRTTDSISAVMNVTIKHDDSATAFGSQMPNSPWNNSCTMDVQMGGKGKYRLWRGNSAGKNVTGSLPAFYDAKNEVRIDSAGLSWKPFGAGEWTQSLACSTAGHCAQNMFVFASNAADAGGRSPLRFAIVQLYSLRVCDDNQKAVCDLVPARRLSDGAIGLLDVAGSEPVFRPNLGATALSAGPAMTWPDDFSISPGELHIVVPEGVEMANSTVTLAGGLKVVKEGDGVYVSAKNNQSYSGGNDVRGGSFRCGTMSGSKGCYGSGSARTTIREGAVLDLNGYSGHGTGLSFVLDGGCISNGVNRGFFLGNSLNDLTVTKDSTLSGFGFGLLKEEYGDSTINLGGHTLYLDVSPVESVGIFLMNTYVRGGGRIVGRNGGGQLLLGGNTSVNGKFVDAPGVVLEMRDVAIADLTASQGQLVFGGYESAYAGLVDAGTNSLEVAGTFKPALGAKWHNVLLKDGATLDLSEQTGCLTNVCLFAGDQRGVISFPANATITIDLGMQRHVRNGKILDWTNEPPADYMQVNFVRPEDADYRIYAESDGLYVEKGFIIYVR